MITPAARTAAYARLSRWRDRHAARLAAMHPDVRTEVESLKLSRLFAGSDGMSEQDLHECKMRVASRLRLRRYGPCDGDEESGRQLREVLAALGGGRMEAA